MSLDNAHPLHSRSAFKYLITALLALSLIAAALYLTGCAKKTPAANNRPVPQSTALKKSENAGAKSEPLNKHLKLKEDEWSPLVKLAEEEYFIGIDAHYNLYTLKNYKEVKRYSPAGKLEKTLKLDASMRNYTLEYGAVTSSGIVTIIGESMAKNAPVSAAVLANADQKDKLTAFAPTKDKNVYSIIADGDTLIWDEINAEIPTTYALNVVQQAAQPTLVRACPENEKKQPLHLDSLVTDGMLSFTDGQTSILYSMHEQKTLESKHLYATNEMVYFNGKTQGYVSPEGKGFGKWLASDGLRLPSGKAPAKSILNDTLKINDNFNVGSGGIANVHLSTYQQGTQNRGVFGQAFDQNKNYSYIVVRLAD